MSRRHENNIAALCHVCNAIPIWGLIFCGLIWFGQREKSRYVIGQSLQAMYFHGLLLGVIVAWILIGLFTRIIGFLYAPLGEVLEIFNQFVLIGILVSYAFICLWGAWRVAQGASFRYPLVRPL